MSEQNAITELSQEFNPRFIRFYKQTINILIYIANENEFACIIDFLKSNNNHVVSFIDNGNTYYVAKMGLYPVAIVCGSCIGQMQIGACDTTIVKALKTFHNIKYLVTIGICAGISQKVRIGDVIVANEIIDYDSQKIEESKIIDRTQGLFLTELKNIVSTKVKLMKFSDFSVHFGNVLSGSKVVDSKTFSENLKTLHQEALALEMEGYAISRLAFVNKMTDWLCIKAVSDLAYNKQGSAGQYEYMKHAIKVAMELFNHPDIFNTMKIKVMISGSYVFDDSKTKEVEEFSYALTQKLVDLKYKVVSGYGKCVGNAVVAGAYNAHSRLLKNLSDVSIQDYIEVYPFPKVENPEIVRCLENIKYENRQLMAKDCSFCIFIYGKKDSGALASGMEDEFRLTSNSFPIPVGCTGFKAKELWQRIKDDFERYYPKDKNIVKAFDELNNDENNINQTIDAVVFMMDTIKNYYFKFKG